MLDKVESLKKNKINDDNKLKDENVNEKEILKNQMSKGQKLFWIVIIIFSILYIILSIFASSNMKDLISQKTNIPFLHKYVTTYLPDDTIKNNISNAESIINKKLNEDLDIVNAKIDKEIEELFIGVEKNVDKYLDFHYSVIGEYTELTSLAVNTLSTEIQDKLFGSEFDKVFKDKMNNINQLYRQKVEEHTNLIVDFGIDGIDKELNNDSLRFMINDIENFRNLILGKSLIVGTAIGSKIALALSSKIAARIITKASSKLVVKSVGKLATSSAAAGAGLSCGPLVWICAPAFATVAWFGTDALVVAADEKLNREEFKNEIMISLNESKDEIKYNLKKSVEEEFKTISEKVKNTLKNTEIIKKEKIRLEEKIRILFETKEEK